MSHLWYKQGVDLFLFIRIFFIDNRIPVLWRQNIKMYFGELGEKYWPFQPNTWILIFLVRNNSFHNN